MNRIYTEKTYRLFTPGPGNVPPRVALAASVANYHHRTKEFGAILCGALEGIQPLFGTREQVVTVHTTGRGALEGAFNNFLLPERDKVLVICNGRFGEMGKEILQANRIPCVPCYESWTDIVDPAVVKELAVRNHVTAIFMVHSDTATGVLNPVADVGRIARELNLLFFVDVISSLGCVPFEFDEWGVDVAVAGIQKGLMCPAGMSVMAVSQRAMKANESIPQRDYYINIRTIRNFLITKREAPLTAPVSLSLAMNEAVNMIHEEGVSRVFRRHEVLSRSTKAAVEAMGLDLYPKGEDYSRSAALTVLTLSGEMDRGKIMQHMQNKYGYMLSAGIGENCGAQLRIAHMGYCYMSDILGCLNAFECTLYDLGYRNTVGTGVQAFLDTYNALTKDDADL